jgi:alkylhydroperoxidase family enzyme
MPVRNTHATAKGSNTVHLAVHTLDDAPADSRAVLEGIAADLGFIPNLAAVAAASPALLAGFDGMRRAVASAKLDPVLREVAGVAVGVAVGNHYGIAFHSTVLGKLGFDESQITALRQGTAPADATVAAVSALARQVVLDRGKLSDAVLAEATSAGLSAEGVLDVVLECAFATLVGLIDNLAGHVELDAFLVPRAWSPGE